MTGRRHRHYASRLYSQGQHHSTILGCRWDFGESQVQTHIWKQVVLILKERGTENRLMMNCSTVQCLHTVLEVKNADKGKRLEQRQRCWLCLSMLGQFLSHRNWPFRPHNNIGVEAWNMSVWNDSALSLKWRKLQLCMNLNTVIDCLWFNKEDYTISLVLWYTSRKRTTWGVFFHIFLECI